jgi:hypothetical protein
VFFGEKQTGRENVAKTSREGGRREERRERREPKQLHKVARRACRKG